MTEVDVFNQFFVENPTKILGSKVETTDRFGNPTFDIKGDLSNLEAIDVPDQLMPERNEESASLKLPTVDPKRANENIEKSITLSQSYKTKPDKPRKKTKSKKGAAVKPVKDHTYYDFDYFIKNFNEGITRDEIEVWVWYRNHIGRPLSGGWSKYMPQASNAWFDLMQEKGYLCMDEDSFSPSPIYYSGNIYEKIERLTSSRLKEFNKKQFEKQEENLLAILPKKLLLTGPEEERLFISPLSKFARTFLVYYQEEEQTIYNAFVEYLATLEDADYDLRITSFQIVQYYLEGNRFPRGQYDEYEKAEIKRNASIEAARKMSDFLAFSLNSSERNRIEHTWNKQHNGYVDVNYDKIPVAFSCNSEFKKSKLSIRAAQREGVAFQSVLSTGIIAYDVGVGKTLTSILAIGQALESGECSRPLIVVPKPTYDKWLGEIGGSYDPDTGEVLSHGLLPQYPIIELFNLSDKYRSNVLDASGNIRSDLPTKAIFVATYEGFMRIGFSKDMEGTLLDRMRETVSQGYASETERRKALEDSKLEAALGVGLENTIVEIDKLKLDYLTIDEAHNFNKIFSSVQGETKEDQEGRESSNYQISGNPSQRGIKAFFLSQYVQSASGGNICLLTATPFNNNPLEVFSMLALTNYSRLKTLGINNIVSFFDNYVNQTFEKVLTASGNIEIRAVIKSFSNKVSLQKVVFGYMNYKSGEDANIQRPQKWTLPMISQIIDKKPIPLPADKQITTYLQPSDEQRENIKKITEDLLMKMADPILSQKAPHLVAISESKANAVSPYVYYKTDPDTITPEDFILSSPKLQYTMECMKSVIEHHKKTNTELSCMVIYIDGGVNYLHLIKQYLEENLGYKRKIATSGRTSFDEVEVISGSGAFKRSDQQKEEIKSFFLEGTIKVIIGTSTIREGIDLQNKSSNLFNLWLDWNPTNLKQLDGRIWRFGNMYENIRITIPLLIGSSDAFVFQKQEEKTARINDLFDRQDKSNMIDVDSLDPEEVKWSIIDDIPSLAKAQIREEVQAIKKEQESIESNIRNLKEVENIVSQINNNENTIKTFADKYKAHLSPEQFASIEDVNNHFQVYRKLKQVKKTEDWGYNVFYDKIRAQNAYSTYKKLSAKLKKLDEMVANKYNATVFSDLSPVIGELEQEAAEVQYTLNEKTSEEYYERLVEELTAEKEKFSKGRYELKTQVQQFSSLNYLLDILRAEEQTPERTKDGENAPDPDGFSTPKIPAASKAEYPKKVLQTRLKIVKKMAATNPDKKVLKTRIKLIEKMLSQAA